MHVDARRSDEEVVELAGSAPLAYLPRSERVEPPLKSMFSDGSTP